jgi:hypothetical protein
MRILALPPMLVALHAIPAKPSPFHGSVAPLPAPLSAALAKHLWHRGCPVSRSQLRLLTVSYIGFDRQPHSGELVVNADAAGPLLKVFRRLFELRFRIREMRALADSGDDTAAFECRDAVSSPCPGTPPTHSWSEHAYGEAVDINPIENPYAGCGRTRAKASPYLNRSEHRHGMVTAAVVQAFASIGWGWGGSWSGTKDYMHFSATGH